jgi:hypothetical protein
LGHEEAAIIHQHRSTPKTVRKLDAPLLADKVAPGAKGGPSKMQRYAAIFIRRGRAQDHESLRRFLLTEEFPSLYTFESYTQK